MQMIHQFMSLMTPYKMSDLAGIFGPLKCNTKSSLKDLAAIFQIIFYIFKHWTKYHCLMS